MPHDDQISGSDYADSVRDVLSHAARAEAAAGERREPRSSPLLRGPGLAVLAVVFGGVLAYNVRAFSSQPEALPPEEAEVSAGITVMIATQAVEAYRREHGRLPASLEELGFPAEGLRYSVDGNSYVLTAGEGESAVEYSPTEPPLGILEEMGVTVPGATDPDVRR